MSFLPPWEENAMQPTPVLLPGKSHGQRSLVGCIPWGRVELDTTEWLHFHFSLSRIGEGYGNPLQCSWLENPRDGGDWWAAVYGVAQWSESGSVVSDSLWPHGLSMEFSRPEYWSGYSPGDLPDPGIKPGSPALQADSLPTELSEKPESNTAEAT